PRPGDQGMMRPLIIRRGSKRHAVRRALDGLLTLGLWGGYLYLMRHAVSVPLSYFRIEASWGLQYNDVSVPPIVTDIKLYAFIVGVQRGVFILGALYNKIRFGRRDRRRRAYPVTPEELAQFFNLSPLQVEHLQTARRLSLAHTEQGRLIQGGAAE